MGKKYHTIQLIYSILIFISISDSIIYQFINPGINVRKIIKLAPYSDQTTIYKTNPKIYVAVIDDGFDTKHAAYSKNISKKYQYSTDMYSDSNAVPSYRKVRYQISDHGTHIAGILCGLLGKRYDGSYAIHGIAPHIKLILVQKLPDSTLEEVVRIINDITNSPAKIVSLSIGFGDIDKPMHFEIKKALLKLTQSGKILVIAAGNQGTYLEDIPYYTSLLALAKQAKGRVILAGASEFQFEQQSFLRQFLSYFTNPGDTLADFSNRPATDLGRAHFICAPGVNILSSASSMPFNMKLMSGTSMAAPIVAGALACIVNFEPDIDKARDLLFSHARTHNLINHQSLDQTFGAGIIDLSFLENFSNTHNAQV